MMRRHVLKWPGRKLRRASSIIAQRTSLLQTLLYDRSLLLQAFDSSVTIIGRSTIGPLYCLLPISAYQTNPIITKPPKTAIDQFMETVSTGVTGGKKLKKVERIRKTAENALTATPALPILQGPYLMCSPLIFLIIISIVGIRYEMKRPASVSETMALKATVLPMLIRPIRHGTILQSTIARRGSASVLLTFAK